MVFGAIEHLGIGLLFRPLDGLLGAYIPVENDSGILVTTERPLAIQRFTGAHELGHAYLKHELRIDDEEILKRSPFARPIYDLREIAADTFAALFLMPDWLINLHAERQGWDWRNLSDPICVYQARRFAWASAMKPSAALCAIRCQPARQPSVYFSQLRFLQGRLSRKY